MSNAPLTAPPDDSVGELWFKLIHIAKLQGGNDPPASAPDRSETHQFFIVGHDEVHIAVDGRLHKLKRGAVYVCHPGQQVEYMGGPRDEACVGYWLSVAVQGDPRSLKHALAGLHTDAVRSGFVVPEACAAVLLDLCDKAYSYWHGISQLERLRGQAAFHEALFHLLHQSEAVAKRGLHEALEQVKHYLDGHYDEPLSLEELAPRYGISSRHFRRAFKIRYGINPTDYVTDLRMSQAKRLLTAAKQPAAEIARLVGYQNESHFRRTFKSRMGVSPAVYVRNRGIKVAACSFPNIGQLLPLSIIPFAAPLDHEWTDAYRRKYHTEVLYPLHHDNIVNFRTLLAAKPDRILAIDAYGSPEFQQQLSQIAPVLIIPWRDRSWREHLAMTASFLQRTEAAEEWLADYDRKADLVCERFNRLPAKEATLFLMVDRHTVYRWIGGQGGSMSRQCMPFAPERHKPGIDPAFEPIETDTLAAGEAGLVVLLQSEDRHSALTWEALRQSAGWKQLKAVRGDRVRTVRIGPWFEYTAHNHGVILEQLMKLPL
ncbi:MAG: helix-turn-helix domain-containing protein [Paenibacillaceae bacterium]|nr:helix-turn-helix domain-containing protein [Paenibacillaceae bacterium]